MIGMCLWNTLSNSMFQAVSHGQLVGRCSVSLRAEEAIRAGTVISLRRMVAVVGFGQRGSPVMVRGGAGEVERDHRQTSQAAFAEN